jgi:hypothetical protein
MNSGLRCRTFHLLLRLAIIRPGSRFRNRLRSATVVRKTSFILAR